MGPARRCVRPYSLAAALDKRGDPFLPSYGATPLACGHLPDDHLGTTRCLSPIPGYHAAPYLPPPGRAPGWAAKCAAVCLYRADVATRSDGVRPALLCAAALLRYAG